VRTLWRLLAAVTLLAAGCAPVTATRRGEPFLDYADGREYIMPTHQGPMAPEAAGSGTTHYVHANSRRICYAFQVPGTWEPGREIAMLRRVDGKGLVGVLLLDVHELGATSTEEAIRVAAERSHQLYAEEAGTAPWTLQPYPRVPRAWMWTLRATGTIAGKPGAVVTVLPRWFLPVGDQWIAQFTIGAPLDVDREAFVAGVLQSLTTSREPRCYEARLRELGAVR
jgi:hypothetical protein